MTQLICLVCTNSESVLSSKKIVVERFPINVGLRQGYVMSPWMFNAHMDGVVGVMSTIARVLGKGINCTGKWW